LSPTSNPTPTPTSSPTPTPTTTTTTTPSPTLPPGPQTYDIRIQDFSYYPGTLNVKKGDIVRFTNYDSVKHNAVADGGQWATPLLSQGESATLDTSNLALGTYRYHCSIHPQMVGTLRILE
jgi:plastocyanin